MCSSFILKYKQDDEIFKFLSNNIKNTKVECVLAEDTVLQIEDKEFKEDELIQEIVKMYEETMSVKEFKKNLSLVSNKKQSTRLGNAMAFYNTMEDALATGTLKNYDFLKEMEKEFSGIVVDFYLLEIKVGTIAEIDVLEGIDKIYREEVEFGKENAEEKRIICSGLRKHYEKEDLKGKTCLFMTNLKEAKFGTEKSQGMICCGSNEEEGLEVITVDKKYQGQRISLKDSVEYIGHVSRKEIQLLKKPKYGACLEQFNIKDGKLCFNNTEVVVGGESVIMKKLTHGKMG